MLARRFVVYEKYGGASASWSSCSCRVCSVSVEFEHELPPQLWRPWLSVFYIDPPVRRYCESRRCTKNGIRHTQLPPDAQGFPWSRVERHDSHANYWYPEIAEISYDTFTPRVTKKTLLVLEEACILKE